MYHEKVISTYVIIVIVLGVECGCRTTFAWGGATELYSGQRATVESGAVTFPAYSNKVAIIKAD
ncbi:MAG: hypothetical protein PUD39_03425 [Bacteroidales bacterium]|nr:hypothetical protein [Bacteroidales bacterium]